MLKNIKEVLVLAPHTDDGELGLGGTISYFLENKINVTYIAFSIAEQSVPVGFPKDILRTEVQNATAILGIDRENLVIYNFEVRKLNFFRQEILEKLIELRKRKKYDLVFVPSLNDIHQDHQTVSLEGLRAFKNCSVLGYELIWNNISFENQCFISLEKRHIENKIKSLREYKSQGFRDYLSEEFIFSLAKTRGVQIGVEFAECFQVIRLIL